MLNCVYSCICLYCAYFQQRQVLKLQRFFQGINILRYDALIYVVILTDFNDVRVETHTLIGLLCYLFVSAMSEDFVTINVTFVRYLYPLYCFLAKRSGEHFQGYVYWK